MINKEIFYFLRDNARDKLDPKVAAESFGYYIDITDQWEHFKSPKHLMHYLGIHFTHEAQYGEICKDIGEISKDEIQRAKRQLEITKIAGNYLFSDGSELPNHGIRFDLAETLFDWRNILKFKPDFDFIIDYGAGSGRQSAQAFSINKKTKYIGIDATLAGYTVQNIFYNCVSNYYKDIKFFDLLDFEYLNKKYPNLNELNDGTIVHFPAWNNHDFLPTKKADLILACHVHNELSGSDFLRLMDTVKKSLSDEGIFYVRSELGIWQSKNYFDAIDFHAIDPVIELKKNDIVPIHFEFEASFMTTVFARKNSKIYNKHKSKISKKDSKVDNFKKLIKSAIENKDKIFKILGNKKARDLTKHIIKQTVPHGENNLNSHEIAFSCAKKMLNRVTNDYKNSNKKILFVKNNFPTYDLEFEKICSDYKNKIVFEEKNILNENGLENSFIEAYTEFNPDVIIVSSQNFNKVKELIINRFSIGYFTKIHYTYPVFIIDKKDYRLDETYWLNL